MHNRRYNLIFLLLFATALLAVALTNYLVDPANLFRSGFEYRAATQLVSGQRLDRVGDIDDRLLKRYFVEQMPQAPDIVAMGTSRSYPIGEELFAGYDFVNLALTGAIFEDLAGIYGVMRDNDRLPDVIVLEVIPWIFNDNAVRDRWRALGSAAEHWNHHFLGDISAGVSPRFQKLTQLVSVAYFRESIRFLKKGGEQAKQTEHTGNAYLPDLTIVFGQFDFTEAQYRAFLDEKAVAGLRNDSWSFRNFITLSAKRRAAFVALLDQMQQDGVGVVFYAPPFYRTSWQGMISQPRFAQVVETVSWFEALAEARGIPLYGNYDQDAVPCVASDFFDPIHPRRECVAKIFAPLVTQLQAGGLQAMTRPVPEE